MEALKVWSSRPLRHLFHLASPPPPTTKSYLPVTFVRFCCSSSSTSAAVGISAAVSKQSGRSRRSSAASTTTSTSDREANRTYRLKKVEELRSKGFEHYAYKWDRSHTAKQLLEMYKHLGNGEELNGENDQVSISGRIVARRAFGKLALLTLRDDSGTIQGQRTIFMMDEYLTLNFHHVQRYTDNLMMDDVVLYKIFYKD